MSPLTQIIIQALLGVIGSIVAALVGYVLTRQLRKIFATAERTEEHARSTQEQVSRLDLLSTSSWQAGLEGRINAVDERVSAIGDERSASLGWRATLEMREVEQERRLAALEAFAAGLSALARDSGAPRPTYTPPERPDDVTD